MYSTLIQFARPWRLRTLPSKTREPTVLLRRPAVFTLQVAVAHGLRHQRPVLEGERLPEVVPTLVVLGDENPVSGTAAKTPKKVLQGAREALAKEGPTPGSYRPRRAPRMARVRALVRRGGRHRPVQTRGPVEAREPGNGHLVAFVNKRRATWAVARQWASFDEALAGRDAEIGRLQRITWDAIYALRRPR